MKIGVLTYHRVVNLGSVLQAWCVVQFLSKLFPLATIEIIDYMPRVMQYREKRKYLKRKYPFININQIKKNQVLGEFIKNKLPLTSNRLITDNVNRAMSWFDNLDYDLIFVGSDTVWELRKNSYSPSNVNAYFLPYSEGAKKISFAASMDPVVDLSPEQIRLLGERINTLRNFDLITVRDSATQQLLIKEGIMEKKIHQLCDPTFLADFKSLAEPSPVIPKSEKPVVGVSLPEQEALKVHKTLYDAGYEVWDWRGIYSRYCNQIVPADLTVGEVLDTYRKVSGFITDRFHGSIITFVMAEAPVIFYESSHKWPWSNSKGRDLFKMLGFDSFVERDFGKLQDAYYIKQKLSQNDSFVGINARIQNKGKSDTDMLKSLLSEISIETHPLVH